jgi:hypothetical protein
VNGLEQYLDLIVEPTFKDFERNPSSVRHAYLACVAAYHAVDRAAHPSHPGNLKKKWRDESFEFVIVDMVAHHFKHVISDDEKAPTPSGNIPLSTLVFGDGTLNSAPLNTEVNAKGHADHQHPDIVAHASTLVAMGFCLARKFAFRCRSGRRVRL